MRHSATPLLGLLALAAGCSHFHVRPASDTFEPTQYAPARLSLEGSLAVARVEGTPTEIGAQLGTLTARPTRELLSSWRFADFFRSMFATSCAEASELQRVVPRRYLSELEVLSRIAGVDSSALLSANAVVDACGCTAFAASGSTTRGAPLLVGRNMDFAPANVLGAKTLVTVYRPAGLHAFASVGWPGCAAVVSGMNDQGLVALILINSGAGPRGDGIPLAFLVRQILEECSTVEEARAFFHEHSPASGHFVFLADARTATIVSRDADDHVMKDELLACTNGKFAPGAVAQTDARARCAWSLLHETAGTIDLEAARSILAATYMKMENTHAMVLEPATRTLWLARGTTFEPAALAPWERLDLAPAFAGGPLHATPLAPATERFAHWKAKDYPATGGEQKLTSKP